MFLGQEDVLSGPRGCRTTPPVFEPLESDLTGLPTILLSKLSVEVGTLAAAVFGISLRSIDPDPKMIDCLSLLFTPFLGRGADVGVTAEVFVTAFEGNPFCWSRLGGRAGTGGIVLFSPGAAVCMYIDRLEEADAATARRSFVECLGVRFWPEDEGLDDKGGEIE